MSHSTEIKVEIGLDSYHLHCGSRHPAEYCGVAADQSKTLVDDAALAVLWNMPHNGAGRMALFGVLYSEAEENKSLYAGDTGWLKVEIIHCPRALAVDLVTGARRKVTVIVWPANPAFLEVTDTEAM